MGNLPFLPAFSGFKYAFARIPAALALLKQEGLLWFISYVCLNQRSNFMKKQEELKSLLIRFRSGNQSAAHELYVRFSPLIYKMAKTKNSDISREDLIQDLWAAFFGFARKFDVEKVRYFPVCMARRLYQEKVYRLKKFSLRHEREGRNLENLAEEGYIDAYSSFDEDMNRILHDCGCTERMKEVVFTFAADLTSGERCKRLEISQQALSQWKKKVGKLIAKNEELEKYLKDWL